MTDTHHHHPPTPDPSRHCWRIIMLLILLTWLTIITGCSESSLLESLCAWIDRH